jgi:uncharacterized DUF497 family protein
MRFEWDERKRLANLEKHGLDFFEVIGVFEGRLVTVVYTTRSEAIRIISFRRARHAERQKYQEIYSRRA